LVKAEIIDNSGQNVETVDKKYTQVSAVIKSIRDAFSMELGPVSISAQGRVAVPDGLVLKENLDDLKSLCGDIELPSSSSFYTGGPQFGTASDVSSSNLLKNDESGPINESTSLLEHRKRHGLYYLASDKSETVPNYYPPANDPKANSNINDEADALAKLTEQSLLLKKKTNQMKPRPVVVKLDDGDAAPVPDKRPEPINDSLSGAIKDVLLGSETNLSVSRSNPLDKSSTKRKGKKKLGTDLPSEMKENLGDAEKPHPKNPNPSSKSKERRRRGKEKIGEGEESDQRGKKKSSHRHGRHKTHQRANSPLNVVSQAPVIPDFLL
jgi:AP-3 complex subunit delta-1